MTNPSNPSLTYRRPETTRRSSNPFEAIPIPIPMDGFGLTAPEIFREKRLASHLDRNASWLQAHPRTSNAIEAALYPEYSLCGMEPEEVRQLLNRALWDAGYTPSNQGKNPVWTWTEGE